MTVGSFSTNLYGIHRSTKDADFVIQASAGDVSELARRLGPPFRLDHQLSFVTITGMTRYILRVEDEVFKGELFLLSDDRRDQERFRRRVSRLVGSRAVFFPSPEDVVVTKLHWSWRGRRAKDLEDVKNVIAVQAKNLDWAYIERWCDQHGTRELLEEIRASLPPNL